MGNHLENKFYLYHFIECSQDGDEYFMKRFYTTRFALNQANAQFFVRLAKGRYPEIVVFIDKTNKTKPLSPNIKPYSMVRFLGMIEESKVNDLIDRSLEKIF